MWRGVSIDLANLDNSFQQESVQISFFSENKDNAFSDDKSSHGQGEKRKFVVTYIVFQKLTLKENVGA